MIDRRHRAALPPASYSMQNLREFELLLADLSAWFINLPPERVDGAPMRRVA